MPFRGLLLIAAVAVWTASPASAEPGDWPTFKSGPERTSFNSDETTLGPGNVATLAEKWTIKLKGALSQAAVVADGVVFVVTSQEVSAYRASTGRRIWRRNVTIPGTAAPAVSKGVVYVALEGARMMALDAKSGKINWTSKFSNLREQVSRSSPLVSNGLVYVGGGDGKLHALKQRTGKVEFSAKTTAGKTIIGSPALADGVVYIGSSDGRMYAFNASSGRKLWSFKANGAVEGTPAVDDGKVFFGNGGLLYALDAKTGKEKWTKSLGGARVSTPAVADGTVVVTADNAFAFNADTGRPLWEGFTAQSSIGPVIANGIVYTLNAFGRVATFDLTSGTGLSALVTGAGAPTYDTPVVSNGVVYVTASDNVQAYSAD